MIITQSVNELINELCMSLQSDLKDRLHRHEPNSKLLLKSCKSRTYEILIKKKSSTINRAHELYLHQFELAVADENSQRCLKMGECCRLIESDEYFKTEIGQSILTLLLKLRNSVKHSNTTDQDKPSLTNYFFKTALCDRNPYFFLPPEIFKFDGDKNPLDDLNPFTVNLLKNKTQSFSGGKNFFELLAPNEANAFQFPSRKTSDVTRTLNRSNTRLNTVPTPKKNESIIIRCARWDNLGQPMDYLNARFTSEVDVTNELFAITAFQDFEAKIIPLSQLMVDIKLLLTGIQSDSFQFDDEKLVFYMETNLTVENISPETMATAIIPFLHCGSCYRRLQIILSRSPMGLKYKFDGFVFKTLCASVASFLMLFHQFVYAFEDTFLAQLSLRISFMIQQIETLASILGVHPNISGSMDRALAKLPRGSKFLDYLYRKFSVVTQPDVAMLLFTILKECCTVYFKHFETWIFRGFMDDPCKELFIEFMDFYQPNTKHFWDKAYTIQRPSVPAFLLGCEEATLLCGKYTMLLQTIKPKHPFLAIRTPSIEVCFSHQQIDRLQSICNKYVEEAQNVCGPKVTVRQIYRQKSIKRTEFQLRCAVRFQENLEQWHEEQILLKLKVKSNQEKNRKILEEQIREVRERKIEKRKESLARDREYLREQEILENRRLEKENVQREKTLEYYKELSRIVNEQHQRVNEKINIIPEEITQPCDDVHKNIEVISVGKPVDLGVSDVPEVINDDDEIPVDGVHVETNMKKSASDYFNSNDIPSEFTTNKMRVMGSTIQFKDVLSTPRVQTEVLDDVQKNKSTTKFFLKNQINLSDRDANSNELPAIITERQRNKTKALASEIGLYPVVVKISKSTEAKSNVDFQNNQQRSAAHTDIFGNETIDEFKRNRNRVLTEEFDFTPVDENEKALQQSANQIQITPVDWKPVRTSLSLDFAKNSETHTDAATPMSISSDTPTIHEDVRENSEPKLRIELPVSHIPSCHDIETAETINSTPNSALNTAGIMNKYGFVFETPPVIPTRKDCYDLNFSLGKRNESSFFALSKNCTSNEVTERNSKASPNLNDLKNASITTITNFLKMSFLIPIHTRLSILNNEILKIFLQDLDILGHLKSLRNVYFMMDGEFSSCVSNSLITRLECTKSPTELFNFQFLHTVLHNALNSSIFGNDQNADRLSFLITDVPEKFDLASPNVLRTLNLSYHIDWPLNLVLTPEAMSQYANIFQHLLKVRRISWVLEQCYQILKEVAKRSKQKISSAPQYRHVQQIRSKLLTFINALQNHITSNALQASWRAFKIDLEATTSIEDLYHKHAKYLKRVKFLCMLNRRSADFFTKLEDVFIVVLRFYHQLKQRSWRSDNTHPNFAKLLIIEKDFHKLIKFIIRIGSKISTGYQTEIGDFINIIDFNGFYENVGPQSHS